MRNGRTRRKNMGRLNRTSLLLLLLAALAARCFAFAPRGRRRHRPVASRSCSSSTSGVGSMADGRPRRSVRHVTALRESSSGDDDGSSAINVALIAAATSASGYHDRLRALLEDHPFCKMTGVKLSIADVPVSADTTSSLSDDDLSLLREADIACFGTAASVTLYLSALDDHFGAGEATDEERRKLPNRPELDGAPPSDDPASLMAACPTADAARECLNSGRWMANDIYYPKDTQGAVELRTEPAGGPDDDGDGSAKEGGEEEDGDVDAGVWADSVIQAAGDVMERKFWGGGW